MSTRNGAENVPMTDGPHYDDNNLTVGYSLGSKITNGRSYNSMELLSQTDSANSTNGSIGGRTVPKPSRSGRMETTRMVPKRLGKVTMNDNPTIGR